MAIVANDSASSANTTSVENNRAMSDQVDSKEPKESESGEPAEPNNDMSSSPALNTTEPQGKGPTASDIGASKQGHRGGGRGEFSRDGRKYGRGEGRHAGRYEHRPYGREGADSGHRSHGPPKRDEREGRGRGRGRDGREGRGGRIGPSTDTAQPAHNESKNLEVPEASEGSDEFATISSRKSVKADEEKVRLALAKNEELARSVSFKSIKIYLD